MLFFKKKKLLEMDQKIDSLMEFIQEQGEQMNGCLQYMDKLMNQQKEIKEYLEERVAEVLSTYISDVLEKETRYYNLLQRQIQGVQDQIIEDILKYHKIAIENLESDKEELMNFVSRYIEQMQEKSIKETISLFSTMSRKLELLAENVGNNHNQIKQEFGELNRFIDNTVTMGISKALDSDENMKNNIIEEIKIYDDNIVYQSFQRLNEVQNSQEEIVAQLEMKLKDIVIEYFSNVSEKNKEYYHLLQKHTDGVQNQMNENLLEYQKRVIENLESDKEELKESILRYFDQMQEKNINKITSLFDFIRTDFEILSKSTEKGFNQTEDRLCILNEAVNNTVGKGVSEILDSNENTKNNLIEICNEVVKQGSQRFSELRNGQDEIKNQLDVKSDEIYKEYISNVLEKNEEYYSLFQSQVNGIIKLFSPITENIDALSRTIENNQEHVINTLCETENVVKKVESNHETMKQDIELLDNGLRMLLLNSIMEQLPQG